MISFIITISVKTSLSVLVDTKAEKKKNQNNTKAVLTCPPVQWPSVLVTWEIVLRDKQLCFRAYRRDTNQTTGGNCTDKRITWASGPDENPALQIGPVAITHDGNYTCQIATSNGNFQHEYHLQVLGAPEVFLVLIEKGTAVCKEVSEKLPAQTSRTPEGDCVTEQEPYWGKGTATVQSTCPGRAASCVLLCLPLDWQQESVHGIGSSVLVTWEIVLRDKPHCFRAYRRDTNQTTGGNCTDKRITWASGPDGNPALQIDPVAITHDGNYTCQIATSNGNFQHEYHLQVLVPPEVTLVQTEKGTAVCKAAVGKPAAQISWTPEGDCATEQEPYWGNGTVTVQSTCRWGGRHVLNVSCSVSHLTGNKSLSIELDKGVRTLGFPGSDLLIILCVKSSLLLVILVFVGFIHFQRTNDCRSRK
uniref:Uncharacterized protein n=1 Tax=Ovis aries TaxID=9940 RepID=A0AC11AKM7_SHEEP